MKKLNKLLMPIVGLSTIAATVVPLTSCNKYTNGVEVTKDEWNSALAYLSAITDNVSWKSSKDDVFTITEYESNGSNEGVTATYTDMMITDEYATLEGIMSEGEHVDQGKVVSIAKNNMYFTYSTNLHSDDDWIAHLDTTSDLQIFLILMIASMGGQDGFTFNTQNKTYVFNGDYTYQQVKAHSDVIIRFDSDKKITYIDYHTTLFEDSQPLMIFGLTLHPQYTNVKVDVPQELITKVNERVFEMSSQTKDFTLPAEIETYSHDGVIVNISADAAYTKISAKDIRETTGYAPLLVGIYQNNKLLIKDEDYTTTEVGAYHQIVVTFKNGIAKDDKINIAYRYFADTSKTLTVTLA